MSSLTVTARPSGRPTTDAGIVADLAPRRAALIAGIGYVALFVLAIFANFVVLEQMVVADDPVATVGNLAASPGLFRLGIATFLVIAVIDVIVAWALHALLREVAPDRSQLAAWLRVLHSVFLGVGLVFLAQADHLVTAASSLPSAQLDATAAQVAGALDSFDTMWMVGLGFFGLHLIAVASLLAGPRAAPRALRAVLAFAGVAYVVDTLAHLLLADYDAVAAVMLAIVALPSVIGEGWFGGWLLVRAGRENGARA